MTPPSRRGRCGRCDRDGIKIETTWPDGKVCTTCYAAAVRTRGDCTGCGQQRLVPGRDGTGEPLCVDCAGITNRQYQCSRCDNEWALRRGLCEWCFLADRLDELLDGPVDLGALRDTLLDVRRPDSIIIWLYSKKVQALLTGLARGDVDLDHLALDEATTRQTADHLRGLLVTAGLLPDRDPVLGRYDRWIRERLPKLTNNPGDRRLLEEFARWHQRRSLIERAAQRRLRDSEQNTATQTLRVAAEFLEWLHANDADLATCTQAHLDKWLSTPPTTRWEMRPFIVWAIDTRRAPQLSVGYRRARSQPLLSNDERLAHLRRILDPATAAVHTRVAAMLVLLLAQPLHKIAALTVDDVVERDGELGIRLGNDPTPLPHPFDNLVRELIENRPNLNTVNHNSDYLFPGANAGTHMRPGTIHIKIRTAGIPILDARNAALKQLVTDCPPPLVAEMLGYSYQVTDIHATRAGSPWQSYANLRSDQHS